MHSRGRIRGLALAMTLILPMFCARAAALPKIRVTADGRGFETREGRPFVPFGINYFRPGTGWAPQVWKQFDPEATREDFERMRQVGVNCVRVFLTYGSFLTEAGAVSTNGLAKLDRFLDLAEAAGIYVHPTGPDHWEGLPEWARGDRIAEEEVLKALEVFWTELARRYRDRGVLFAYDLLNEPEVRWDTPVMRRKWNAWVRAQHGTVASLASAWQRSTNDLRLDDLAVPDKQDAPGDARLLDFQRFREAVADEWTRRQALAIKGADSNALVTVGLIQWAVPAVLAHPAHYAAFRPERQAPMLDFMEVHFYPLADGAYHYGGPEAEAKNLAYLECVVREAGRFGKPLVLAEFGWYGGGKPNHVGGAAGPASEEDQARWGRRVIETTAGLASGWLHWGFYDQPEARDVTELIGLAKPDGRLKAWGREFEALSGRFANRRLARPELGVRPVLDWEACIVDGRARREFLEAYTRAWQVDASNQ